ncbi:hypothetical protein ABVK25_010312 [Lepraria finkii]|uniref:Uncharacterized protein n=1 Tax=Lepraria finkii TaxID=1340010 RepID=A0ABR4AUN9_9LECA
MPTASSWGHTAEKFHVGGQGKLQIGDRHYYATKTSQQIRTPRLLDSTTSTLRCPATPAPSSPDEKKSANDYEPGAYHPAP